MSAASIGAHYENYEALILQLEQIILTSHSRVACDPPDLLFSENVNFFTKAYLISLCTYLEAFLQDIAFTHAKLIKSRLSMAKIPNNIIRWHISKDLKSRDLKFDIFDLSLTRKELSDELSGNPHKTIALFRHIGIDLRKSESFKELKELVGSVVEKRNNIIHHNDSAADIYLLDLINYSKKFLDYMKSIEKVVLEAHQDA